MRLRDLTDGETWVGNLVMLGLAIGAACSWIWFIDWR